MNRRTAPQAPEGTSNGTRFNIDSQHKSFGGYLTTPLLIFFTAITVTAVPLLYLTFFSNFFDSVHENVSSNKIANLGRMPLDSSLIAIPASIISQKEPPQSIPVVEKASNLALPKEASKLTPEVTVTSGKPNLPGASGHYILTLSDEELRETSVDKLMVSYGESDGGGTCFQDFGNTLINRWRETKKSFCPRKSFTSSNQLNSNIDCYLVHQTRHHGNGDNLCMMENVAVDLSIFDNPNIMNPVIETYVKTKHMKQPYPPFPKGWLQADCEPDRNIFKDSFMPGWNADVVTRPFQQVTTQNKDTLCKQWIEHPVLLQERDTFANFFHDSEDFVNVFIALAVLQLKPKDVQVFLLDLYPRGPFWEMWSEVYSHQYPTLTSWDLKQKFPRNNDGSSNYVCFKALATGIYGPAAPTTVASWDTPCTKTALVRAYSDFVIRSLNLHTFTHYAESSPSRTVTITFMSRRPSKEWPEKKYCDDANSFFLCKYWENFGPRRLGRMIANDAEVVAALKRLESSEMAESLPAGITVKVQAVDYNVLSFKEQIKIDLETDIMIGPHGAGLMHNIFMRDRAILIELFVDGSSANRHFHNLAHWYGRHYEGLPMNNPINTNDLLEIVKRNIKKLNLRSY